MGADEENGGRKHYEVRQIVKVNEDKRPNIPQKKIYLNNNQNNNNISNNNIQYEQKYNNNIQYEQKYNNIEKNYIKEEKKETENFKTSNNIANSTMKKDFKCTYDKNELLNKLNNYLYQNIIQTKFFEKKDGIYDPVFESIQKEEKDGLVKLFNLYRDSFIKEISNYLNSHMININPNLTLQLINAENGSHVYKHKIEDEIKVINNNPKSFEINYLTVMLLGKSGVGKTTLINKILGTNAPTGTVDPITMQTVAYQNNKKMPFLRLVDTRGIELNDNFGAPQLEKEATRFIQSQLETNNYNNFVHCIWYCLTGDRFEQVEMDILNRLRKSYKDNKIPIIVVYTKSVNKPNFESMTKIIMNRIDYLNDFIPILAKEMESFEGTVLKPFGLNHLITKTLIKCKEALNGEMRLVMTDEISKEIYNNLKVENSLIKDYIYEKSILSFIKGYDNKSDEVFQKSIIQLYAYGIYYYLGKKMGDQSFSLIKNSDIISNHNLSFINYYKNIANSIIPEEALKSLAFEFLNIQAIKEQEFRMPTLNENKRNVSNFRASNDEFLNYNFYCLAQKYYINNYIQYSCQPLAKTFEDSLNNLIYELLQQNDINNLIHKCFLKKYNEFEGRMKKINNKLTISEKSNSDYSYNSNSYNIINNPPINNNNYNAQPNFQQQNYYNKNSNNIKDLSEIESVNTIQLPFNDLSSNNSISSSRKSNSSKNIDIQRFNTINNANNYPNLNSKINNNNMNINYQMNKQSNKINNQYNNLYQNKKY